MLSFKPIIINNVFGRRGLLNELSFSIIYYISYIMASLLFELTSHILFLCYSMSCLTKWRVNNVIKNGKMKRLKSLLTGMM